MLSRPSDFLNSSPIPAGSAGSGKVTIGIIGGNGWLGSAIASAALATGFVAPTRLTLSGRSARRDVDTSGAYRTSDNAELTARSDVVVLSVRPDQFHDVHIDAGGKLVVSVMASVPAAAIAARTGADEVVRSMPNGAAAIRRSFTPWYATPAVVDENKAIVQRLFGACGQGAEVSSEADIDFCAGLTGPGAAFPALLAEAMIAHAIRRGLPAEFAKRAVRGVVSGASQLLDGPDGDSGRVVQTMLDYDGVVAAALRAMLCRGFADSVAAGLDSAVERSAAMANGAAA